MQFTKISNKDYILELNEEAIFLEGLDEAIVGVQEQQSSFSPLYDIEKIKNIYNEKGLIYNPTEQHVSENTSYAILGKETEKEAILKLNDQAIFLEELDEAIVGIQKRDNVIVPLYDIDKMVSIFAEKEISYEEAQEHVSSNILYAYIGKNTPAYAYMFSEDNGN